MSACTDASTSRHSSAVCFGAAGSCISAPMTMSMIVSASSAAAVFEPGDVFDLTHKSFVHGRLA